MFLLRCPRCKQTMKYQCLGGKLEKKRKSCVYCGRNYEVKNNIIKSLD